MKRINPDSRASPDGTCRATQASRTLVLGLGNLLMGDDGAGIEVLRDLEARYLTPEGVDLLDGGTRGLYLLDAVADYDSLLVSDCVALGQTPGEVCRLEAADLAATFSECLSPHENSLNDLLAALTLLDRVPRRLAVIGIEPASLEPRLGLSEPVRSGLTRMTDSLVEQLRQWGIPVGAKSAVSSHVT